MSNKRKDNKGRVLHNGVYMAPARKDIYTVGD